MKQRKILMVLMGLEIGGAETHVVGLASSLEKLGWEVQVASAGGVYEQELQRLGIQHFLVPTDKRSLAAMYAAKKELERIILREKPDIVHAHARIPAFLCGLLQKKLGFRFVTTAHWTFEVNPVLRLVTRWGDRTIAVSEDIRDYLIDNYRIQAGKIHVTVNGIDTQRFSPEISGEAVRREFSIPEDAPVAVCVTRLHESRARAALVLAEIAPELAQRYSGLRILIVGSGACMGRLKKTAAAVNAEVGYECLIITGARTDIPELIRAGNVFVGVSRAALEAMSCAVPTILCGNEGHGGQVLQQNAERYRSTNYCCRDYPETTQKLLLDDIAQVLDMTEQQRRESGEQCREIVLRDFSLMAMAKACEHAYERELEERKHVVVSGYYGYDNLGDDAILENICQRYGQRCDLTVLSRHPVETAKRWRVSAIDRFSILKVRREIRGCDALLSGGGSLLQDRTSSRSLWYYLYLIHYARRCGKTVLVYANGVGPVRRRLDRRLTARILKGADCISVRDADSEQELRKMGISADITVTADPVFSMEKPAPDAGAQLLQAAGVSADRRLLGVSLRSMTREQTSRCARWLDLVCTETGCLPVFISMQPAVDHEAARLVAEQMKSEAVVLSKHYTPGQMLSMLSCMYAVASMRLHTLIFSAVAGTPMLGFDFDPKIKSLLEILQMPCLGTMVGFDPETGVQKTLELLAHRAQYQEILQRQTMLQKAAAAENDRIFEQVVERRGVRKRIAFFQTNLRVGGIQKALVNSVCLPALRNCDIELYLFDREVFFDISMLPDNVTIHYLKPFPFFARLVPFALIRRFTRPFPIEGRFDAAVDFDSYQHDCAFGALSVRADRRVMWIHNDMEIKLREEPKYRVLFTCMRRKYRYYTHFAAVSQGIVEPFRSCSGRYFADVYVVPNLINTDEIRVKAEETPPMLTDPACFNLCSVGRLCHQKGYDLMLQDMAQLMQRRPEARCYLIGDGPDRDSLHRQAERLGIADRIVFTGNLPNPYPMMRQMDAFCLESRYEGQGIVFWEAKALGLPLYFPRRLEKYNPTLRGTDDVVGDLAEAAKLDPDNVRLRFDPLTEYNKAIEETLSRLLRI